jgi:hypothetical protein
MNSRRLTIAILVVAAGFAAAPGLASAQEMAPAPQPAASEKPESKPGPRKVHKVWTNDDLGSVRSPADTYTAQKEAQASTTPPAAKPATSNDKPAPATPHSGGPPALSNPKSVSEADSMIAWEGRDLEAQQGTIAELQKQLDAAPPEQREALQKSLQQRMQILGETQKELEALQAKKEALQNPPSAGSNAAPANPPSQ